MSYSDAVVVATVTSVERIAPGPEEADAVARGEGVLVSRLVTIEVEQVLWHGSTQDVPPKLTFTTDGWVLRNFEEVPFGNSGEVRVEIGGQYLLALEAAGDFGTIRRGVLPIEPDGHVSSAGRTDEAAAQLDGLPLDEVAAKLISTEPKAVADANRHLDPEDRYREMVRMSRATPGG